MRFSGMLATALLALCLPTVLAAQVAFGSAQHDSSLPVEVTSDSLSVNQNDNTALFTGNVVIAQGEMRLSAPRVLVVYLPDRSGIEALEATDGVTLVSGTDAAEAQRADYDVLAGKIALRGNVLLIQTDNAITGETLLVDLNDGTAQVSGRVKTVLRPGSNN